MSKIDFKISHRLHFDFQNITLTSGVLVLTLVVIYLAKHSYSKSKHHTIVSIMKNHTQLISPPTVLVLEPQSVGVTWEGHQVCCVRIDDEWWEVTCFCCWRIDDEWWEVTWFRQR